MKILFNATGNDATGSHRILYPLQALKDAHPNQIECEALNENKLADQLRWADIVLMQCLIGPQQIDLIKKIKDLGKKLILDYDDDFSALPENILTKIGLTSEEATKNWKFYLKQADLVTVPTYGLARVVNEIKSSDLFTKVLPNYIRRSDYAASVSYNPWKLSSDNEVRIIYSCSESHEKDIKYILTVLDWIGTLYKNVKIISHGNIDFTYLCPKFSGKARHYPSIPYDSYLKDLREIKPHIFIAPLTDTPHNRARSGLKHLQSGLLKTAFLCNDLAPYENVKDGIDGYKIKNRFGWAWLLRKLIKNVNLSMSLGLNNFQSCSSSILENHINKWYEAYSAKV